MQKLTKRLYRSGLLWLLLLAAFGLCACTDNTANNGTTAAETTPETGTQTSAAAGELPEVIFPEEATAGNSAAVEADAVITLEGDSAVCVASSGASGAAGVSITGADVTITAAGTYLFTGTLSDGQIIVDTEDEEKVKLIFNGVDLYCSDSAPVYIVSAPKKVIVYLQEGSVNLLSDSAEYTVDTAAADNPTAAIYSKEDLKFDGTGALYVTANYCKGIFTKDDLEIEGGSIYVTAVDDGIRGKDSVTMTGGLVYIAADGDGLRTSNETETDKGWITVSGGELYIAAGQDGIQAITDAEISGGTLVVSCGGGSSNSSSGSQAEDWGNWDQGLPPGGGPGGTGGYGGPGGSGEPGGSEGPGAAGSTDSTQQLSVQTASLTTTTTTAAAETVTDSESDNDTDSAKGIKAGGKLTISGGTITIDSSDDALHANDSMVLNGGAIDIKSGDDGAHADNSLIVSGGSIVIEQSYEGLEALDLQISGGTVHITADDDGLNAAGGNDGSSVDGRPGQNMFGGEGEGSITVTAGYLVIDAAGDGIDSNGTVTMSGGTVLVYGPTNNGNGALDYQTSFSLTGGWLLAVGSSGMAQSPEGDGQAVLACNLNTVEAETILCIQDSSGKAIVTFAAPKAYSNLVFSSADLQTQETYTISAGGNCAGEAVDGLYSDTAYSGGTEMGNVTLD